MRKAIEHFFRSQFVHLQGVNSYPRPFWFRLFRWGCMYWILFPIIFILMLILDMITAFLSLSSIPSIFRGALPIIESFSLIIIASSILLFFISSFGAVFISRHGGTTIRSLLNKINDRPKEWVRWARKDMEDERAILLQRKEAEKQEFLGLKLNLALSGHQYRVRGIAWSLDGKMLVSGSEDWTIRLWNPETSELLGMLGAHSDIVTSVALSRDNLLLASGSSDKTVRIWNIETRQVLRICSQHKKPVTSVSFSPTGERLASGSEDTTICIWDVKTGQLIKILERYTSTVYSVAWSPDGHFLASAYGDSTVRVWNVDTGQPAYTLTDHTDAVYCVIWSPDGHFLISGSRDKTIRIWDLHVRRQVNILERHTSSIFSISFSTEGRLLASKSNDGTVRLWRTNTWELVETIKQPSGAEEWSNALAFHPSKPLLAMPSTEESSINIWELDLDVLLSTATVGNSVRYTNAKVILVGDTGVGKSGLSLALTNQPFVATESSHARHVLSLDVQETELEDGHKETRETLLWDLAGQPGYRLIHQLYLNDVAVALVVFDARSETDPFAGIQHWDRALRVAQRIQGNYASRMRKFLVAARIDRGGIGVSQARIDALVKDLGFDGFFATSAKEGKNTAELKNAIQGAIDWEALPTVNSTELFQRIKNFLVAEKEAGRLLSTVDDLYRTFLSVNSEVQKVEDLGAQFETCIGLVESRDLIKRLSFGNLVLLQPELLDTYASALVIAVRDEPDGLGSIKEEKARAGDFPLSEDERVKDKEQEKLLLIAMVEDLLRHEIALREQADDGPHLIFPSQSTRENPTLPDPKGKAVTFDFEGPVPPIYATLAVRLSHSGIFKKKDLWKNAITYTASIGGTYGIFLHNFDEGHGQIILFFDDMARDETSYHFEQYIEAHLRQRALPESLQRRRVFACNSCGEALTEQQVQLRIARGFKWLNCPVCETRVALLNIEERLASVPASRVQEMNIEADKQRDQEASMTSLQGKMKVGDYDVFLCHNSDDKQAVKQIGEQLKKQGILPWLDEWELRPGLPWQRSLEQQIEKIKSAAVFVGKDGIGPWQQMEIEAFLREFVNRGCPVIPVLLADAPHQPSLPPFLRGMTWVDFRKQEPEPMSRLIWGITGKRVP